MADESGEALARTLADGVAHLRAGRLELAEAALREVGSDPGLAGAVDLADIRVRALSLWADALLQLGRAEDAAAPIREGLEIARAAGDEAGVRALRAHWQHVVKAREAVASERRREVAAARLRELDTEALLERFAGNPLAQADALVKKANAEVEGGAAAQAMVLARRALELARSQDGAVREEVLALLSMARAEPGSAEALLEQAWSRAERANEFTLVGAVVRAAELHGVSLPRQVGPDMGPARPAAADTDDDPSDTMG